MPDNLWSQLEDVFKALNSRPSVPACAFLVATILILGAAASTSSFSMLMQPPNTDIWQHAAALRTLIADLGSPANPFVVSDEGTRHFHPLWVGWAAVAQSLGLTEWDALRLASFVAMIILAVGIYSFGKAFHPSPWMPLILLLTMMFGWILPIQHTGLHSFGTLTYGAAYPATYLVGCSLILWAITIRSLTKPKFAFFLMPIAAVIFAIHQLGAVIGFIGACSFALLWPDGTQKSRILAIFAILVGIGLSTFWPYYNPISLVSQPGHSTWNGGPNFYGYIFVMAALVPSSVGVLGFVGPRSPPLVLALLIYTCLYLVGLSGPQLAGRFLMPITLVLHIGLASYLLKIFGEKRQDSKRKKIAISISLTAIFLLHCVFLIRADTFDLNDEALGKGSYSAALELTHDIPDFQQVAALDVSAWPVVAVGQRVLSVPWPEPAISDLGERQAATALLFEAGLSRNKRIAYADQLGVQTLILDKRHLGSASIDVLKEQSVRNDEAGNLMRFDLRH